VTHEDLAKRITGADAEKAAKLAKQAMEAERMAYIIDSDRQIVNYCYWRLLAKSEQDDETLNARRAIYQGETAFANADLIAARAAYNEGLDSWRKVLDKFPEIIPNRAFGVKLIAMIDRYREILSRLDEQMPNPFILQDILDLHQQSQ